MRDDGREPEQPGTDEAGVDWVVIATDGRVAADLLRRDPDDGIGRRQLLRGRWLGLGFGGEAGALPVQERGDLMPGRLTTSTSRPLRCSRRFCAWTRTPTVSDTAIGRYWSMTFSTCTAPIAENGKSNPVISSITVGKVRANG
jgi:hypothetical protein